MTRPQWKNSKAKSLLTDDILNGTVPDTMVAKDVYQMREDYKAFDYQHFRSNLYNLRKTLKKHQDRANVDTEALAYDVQIRHNRGKKNLGISWCGSEAERLLKLDIDNGNHMGVKPSELRNTRKEYQCFPLIVFRKHIHQEVRGRREKSYWMNRKQTKTTMSK